MSLGAGDVDQPVAGKGATGLMVTVMFDNLFQSVLLRNPIAPES